MKFLIRNLELYLRYTRYRYAGIFRRQLYDARFEMLFEMLMWFT